MGLPHQRLSEARLRDATAQWLTQRLGPNHLIVSELAVENGAARVDIAVIGNQIAGFELKSDYDNLDRLARQMHSFQRVFDQLSVVTTATYLETVERLLPPWWGLIEVAFDEDGSVVVHERRAPTANPRQDPFDLAALLWRDEALEALRRVSHAPIRSKATREEIYRRLAAEMSADDLRAFVVDALRARTSLRERAVS